MTSRRARRDTAIVGKAEYSDPAATEYLTRTIMGRREKVLRTWLNHVNPVVDPVLATDGTFSFANAAIDAGVATPAESYTLQWFGFDNATSQKIVVGTATTGPALTGRAPAALLNGPAYIGVMITHDVLFPSRIERVEMGRG